MAQLIKYYFNDTLFNDLGIYISESSGLTDLPAMKEPLKTNWQDENGETIDLHTKVYASREIRLNCWFMAENFGDFLSKSAKINNLFSTSGLVRLKVVLPDNNALVYLVYLKSEVKYDKKWKENEFPVYFTLELTEPEPVKAVFKIIDPYNNFPVPPPPLYYFDVSFDYTVAGNSDILINIYSQDISKEVKITGSGNIKKTISIPGPDTDYLIITGNVKNEQLAFSNTENLKLLYQGL